MSYLDFTLLHVVFQVFYDPVHGDDKNLLSFSGVSKTQT